MSQSGVLARSLCVALVLVGCKGSDKAPDCEATLSAAIDRMLADAKKSMAGSELARALANAPKLRQALHASCVAEEWSPAALRCFGGATVQADLDACTAKLTHEQYERVRKKIDPLLGPAPEAAAAAGAPPAPAPAPAQAPPAGDDEADDGGGGGGSVASDGRVRKKRHLKGAAGPVVPAPSSDGRVREKEHFEGMPGPVVLDCRSVIVDPKNAACRRQFCQAHPTDPRCEIE